MVSLVLSTHIFSSAFLLSPLARIISSSPYIDSRTTMNILYHFIVFYSCLFSVNIHILSITKARRKKNDYPMEKKGYCWRIEKQKREHAIRIRYSTRKIRLLFVCVSVCLSVSQCALGCWNYGNGWWLWLGKVSFHTIPFLKIFIQLNVSHSTAKTVKNRFIRCETLLWQCLPHFDTLRVK